MKYQSILAFALIAATSSGTLVAEDVAKTEVYGEFNYGKDRGGDHWIQAIEILEPAVRSEIKGDTEIKFRASGMDSATASCWQQPAEEKPDSVQWGHDVNLTPGGIKLDSEGKGSFVFKADEFPNGPTNVRIFCQNKEGKRDIFELQLFNLGGVKWNQGIPPTEPPAIRGKGWKLIFADDFDGPLSISTDGRGARYSSRKPRMGDFSGWQFSDVLGEGKPFSQTGTWLKIAARKDAESPKGRSGLIASIDFDGKGVWAKAPAYLECRFTAQSAIGTWPAFWTITQIDRNGTVPGDELDIVEAYGGMGKGNPNHPGYSLVTHPWGQKNPDGTKKKHPSASPKIMELGGKSYWSTTFHTYAVYIGMDDTVYYFDDIEVFRHPSNDVSKEYPHCFLINYAIGGISGWPIDLKRYGNGTDMWVDYVRVYAENPVPDYSIPPPPLADSEKLPEGTAAIGLKFAIQDEPTTQLRPADATGASGFAQPNWNNLFGREGSSSELMDNAGKKVPALEVNWSVSGKEADLSKTWYWGFEVNKRVLLRSALQPEGKLKITGVPYSKYDVHVYLGANDLGGSGKVTISSDSGSVDPKATYYYKIGYSGAGGKFTASKATELAAAEKSNYLIFSGNTSHEFVLSWDGKLEKEGWSGVAGVHIVAVPE